jgi:hypothetical protein
MLQKKARCSGDVAKGWRPSQVQDPRKRPLEGKPGVVAFGSRVQRPEVAVVEEWAAWEDNKSPWRAGSCRMKAHSVVDKQMPALAHGGLPPCDADRPTQRIQEVVSTHTGS